MDTVPRERASDLALALVVEGYRFAARRVRKYGSDIVEMRLGGRPVTLVSGSDAARVVYDQDRFQRQGAMPKLAQLTLLGVGGVQGLDGAAHRDRKGMLMSFLSPDRARELADRSTEQWRAAFSRWAEHEQVVLVEESAELVCRTVCAWAGVPLPEADVARRTHDLQTLASTQGWPRPNWPAARLARLRAERWATGLVTDVRAGRLSPAEGTALRVIAEHRGLDGAQLDAHAAAVDLLNVLRPTVAVHRYITLAALELHRHPQWRDALRSADDDVRHFVQEVRRTYPVFPMVAARVKEPFSWRGATFPRGRRVFLDLYATNNDPAAWDDPDEFRPERFRDRPGDPFDLVPQGGGDHYSGHRCAGEWVTIELITAAVRALTRDVSYEVPPQDLRVELRTMSTAPRSGLVLQQVRAV